MQGDEPTTFRRPTVAELADPLAFLSWYDAMMHRSWRGEIIWLDMREIMAITHQAIGRFQMARVFEVSPLWQREHPPVEEQIEKRDQPEGPATL